MKEEAVLDISQLTLKMVNELRALSKPSDDIILVIKAALVLLRKERSNYTWANGQKMMSDTSKFITQMKTIDVRTVVGW